MVHARQFMSAPAVKVALPAWALRVQAVQFMLAVAVAVTAVPDTVVPAPIVIGLPIPVSVKINVPVAVMLLLVVMPPLALSVRLKLDPVDTPFELRACVSVRVTLPPVFTVTSGVVKVKAPMAPEPLANVTELVPVTVPVLDIVPLPIAVIVSAVPVTSALRATEPADLSCTTPPVIVPVPAVLVRLPLVVVRLNVPQPAALPACEAAETLQATLSDMYTFWLLAVALAQRLATETLRALLVPVAPMLPGHGRPGDWPLAVGRCAGVRCSGAGGAAGREQNGRTCFRPGAPSGDRWNFSSRQPPAKAA